MRRGARPLRWRHTAVLIQPWVSNARANQTMRPVNRRDAMNAEKRLALFLLCVHRVSAVHRSGRTLGAPGGLRRYSTTMARIRACGSACITYPGANSGWFGFGRSKRQEEKRTPLPSPLPARPSRGEGIRWRRAWRAWAQATVARRGVLLPRPARNERGEGQGRGAPLIPISNQAQCRYPTIHA